MKYVIAHSKTKREISGPLNICGSREDLLWLSKKIYEKARKRKFCFGWVTIEKPIKKQSAIPNTPAKTWD